jgi:phosphoglycolate phosphatase
MLICLFDIDGTLLKINGTGRKVMALALEEVFGNAGPIRSINFAGRTDLSIINETMLAGGVSAEVIEEKLADTFQAMTDIGQDVFFENGLNPCTGVIDLLEEINRRDEMIPGLLTGNASGTARLKLDAAGINPATFSFGAYGSDSANRNALAPIALDRARSLLGSDVSQGTLIVVGDTPADIECAHAVDAPVLAVATGTCSMVDLSKFKPDFLLPDLGNTEQVVGIFRSVLGGSDE